MGLMTFELWQCLNGSINHIAQLHRLAPSKVADHSEPFPVATQGRILSACGQYSSASAFHSSATASKTQADQDCQQR